MKLARRWLFVRVSKRSCAEDIWSRRTSASPDTGASEGTGLAGVGGTSGAVRISDIRRLSGIARSSDRSSSSSPSASLPRRASRKAAPPPSRSNAAPPPNQMFTLLSALSAEPVPALPSGTEATEATSGPPPSPPEETKPRGASGLTTSPLLSTAGVRPLSTEFSLAAFSTEAALAETTLSAEEERASFLLFSARAPEALVTGSTGSEFNSGKVFTTNSEGVSLKSSILAPSVTGTAVAEVTGEGGTTGAGATGGAAGSKPCAPAEMEHRARTAGITIRAGVKENDISLVIPRETHFALTCSPPSRPKAASRTAFSIS